MLADNQEHVRGLGLGQVFKCRPTKSRPKACEFKIRKLNLETDDYINLINWHSLTVIEPPLIASISNDKLKAIILAVPKKATNMMKIPPRNQTIKMKIVESDEKFENETDSDSTPEEGNGENKSESKSNGNGQLLKTEKA
ncbi:hypothetical protein ILUMI_23546 [Ignelater luminosus]|uniref:Uncharacterized protein n=1 Tax=Ignelater luminosus TaxID=2038154 RepID=A0A8K0C7V8_IGNLU|nr:hypothetical protein ILUMI_23546 [Ignelater luminosus]